MVLHDTTILDENGNPIFRSKEFDEEDQRLLRSNYKLYGTLFSLRIHHGGFFTTPPGRVYYDGEEATVDYIDSDVFSILRFNFYVKKLGYDERLIMYYHYLQPDKDDLDFGLKPFACDSDVLKVLSYVGKFEMIHIYIEHAITTIGNWEFTGETSVVIEDITEENENVPQNVVKPRKTFTTLLLEGPSQESCEMNEGLNDVPANDKEPFNEVPINDDEPLNANLDDEPKNANLDDEPLNDKDDEPLNDNEDDEFFKKHLETSDRVNDVEVDMSKFKEHFERDDEWLRKSVEVGVGDLQINEEVLGFDFDQYDSGSSSESDGGTSRKKKVRRVKRVVKEGKEVTGPFYPGQAFMCPNQIKSLIKSHAVESRRNLKFVKNEPGRIRVRCFGTIPCYKKTNEKESCEVGQKVDKGKKVIDQEPTCPWTLYVSKTDQDKYWYVKTLIETHKCLQSREIRWANSTFLSQHLSDTLSSNPEISGRALQDQLQRHFELGLDKQVVYRAKQKAMNKLRGDFDGQYANLRNYALELKSRNPGTTVKIETEVPPHPGSETRIFKRLYICLGPLKEGFKAGGRELLGLDGAFMKGPYPGQVLTAVGVDGNNGIYPLAFGIVEAETRTSWNWFLECLGEDLDLTEMSNFTFVSDRQKGIIPAIERLYPCAEHRFCLRHIHENLKTKFKCGEMYKEMLWNCATRTTVPEFETAMGELRVADFRVHDWLRTIPPKHWARSHFTGRANCDILLNNLCESFNSKLVDARDKPIITCVEYIREYMMKRIVVVQKVIDKCVGPLTPTATLIFEATKKEAAKYTVVWNGRDLYQVKGPWQDQAVVNTTTRMCSCRKWELTGLPCKHAVAAIWNMGVNDMQPGPPEDWVHYAYRLETWKEVYGHKINPVSGPSTWPKSDCPTKLLPPHHHTQVGRPTKKRKRGADEKVTHSTVVEGRLSRHGKTVTCSKCKQRGHNSRRCKGQKESTSSQPTKSKKVKKNPPSQAEVGVGSSQACASQPEGSQTRKKTQERQPAGSQTRKKTQERQPATPPSQGSNASIQRTNTSPKMVVKRFSSAK